MSKKARNIYKKTPETKLDPGKVGLPEISYRKGSSLGICMRAGFSFRAATLVRVNQDISFLRNAATSKPVNHAFRI